jgi:hypothetical protein
MEYTVVEVGYTLRVPVGATVLIPGLIETEFAPLTFHCKLTGQPALILLGLAVKLTITGALPVITATVAEAVTEP